MTDPIVRETWEAIRAKLGLPMDASADQILRRIEDLRWLERSVKKALRKSLNPESIGYYDHLRGNDGCPDCRSEDT